jgi:ubiquinone/menaquinone biosynthesis C-methylase UbiE
MGEEWLWNVMGQMLYSVKTGKPAWARVHGSDAFDYLADNPEHLEIFNRAMTDMTASAAPAIVEAYDFSPFKTIVDIAGGHGYLLSQILKATPGLRGVLFDVEPVIAGAGTILEQEGVTDRVEFAAGNFFESVPSSADAYIMKHIIHDWDDELSNKILRNIARAMSTHAKLLIVEMVVPEGNEPHFSKVMDLGMLVLPGGIERTRAEYHTLLAGADLYLDRIIPTKTPLSIIEAVKA